MALPVLPNTTNFVGVALVINRSQTGPRLIFHYPPHIAAARDRREECKVRADTAGFGRNRHGRSPSRGEWHEEVPPWNQEEHIVTEDGRQLVPWERVAGFPSNDLESILTPGRAYHKSLFHISLDPLHFISYPIHVPENGIWKKKKKKKKRGKPDNEEVDDEANVGNGHTNAKQAGIQAELVKDNVDVKDMASQIQAPESSSKIGKNASGEDKISSMTMFNLVFILEPKPQENTDLIDIIFDNIVRKVNKAYQYVQQHSDFIWKESKMISTLKDKAREEKQQMSKLWAEILHVSSLAASMQDLYENISHNKIAALQFETADGVIAHSVQVPLPLHIEDLPSIDRLEESRGMWLTSGSSYNEQDVEDELAYGDDKPGFLDKNFALLLTDDEKRILTELAADPDDTTSAMIEFVRYCRPTVSFSQVAQATGNSLDLAQIRTFAQHFIYWRRAIAIPPLHARDVYILSPNADMKKLPQASIEWQKTFPFAPSLTHFLGELSTAPKPYKMVCPPSKSLRPHYLQMLAWLMRAGWVTQLCTFAYVVVWPEVIYEVEYAQEAEEIAKMKKDQAAVARGLTHGDGEAVDLTSSIDDLSEDMTSSSSTIQPLSLSTLSLDRSNTDSPGPSTREHGARSPSAASLSPSSSPALSANMPEPTPPTEAEQRAAEARRSRLAAKAKHRLADKATAHARKQVPQTTDHACLNDAPHLDHLAPYIILNAKKPSGKELLYLAAIEKRLRAKRTSAPMSKKAKAAAMAAASKSKDKGKQLALDQNLGAWDARVADAFAKFARYFDGQSALERIALQEEMKRKDVWNLLIAMNEYLMCVRHW